ncbi:hypothetical protein FB451DRAFT_1570235 [Mycena latifolia]|nr:hypothetical protein FB451DRAFT_1570235 [Mycena latifolia]
MPASSLQSRISAFESLSTPPALQAPLAPRVIPSTPPRASPSPSPPNLGRKSSLLDLKIDLKDWVLDDGSPPRPSPFRKTPTQAAFNGNGDDALIHFSPPKPSSVKAPPLPPRKPSLASLKTAASSSSSSLPLAKRSPVAPPPARRGDSLTVEHTYPPTLDLSPRGHAPASSISSFTSVSLSDRSPSPATAVFPQHTTGSSASASASADSESFEELSASAALASPTTAAVISHDWEKAMARRKPPKLPARPPAPATVSPPARRAVPPPPADRASIRSVASASSSTSASTSTSTGTTSKSLTSTAPKSTPALARAPPIPPAPRARYDALFGSLLSAHAPQRPALLAPRRRTAAGWRGLSVDLIRDPTGPASPDDEGGAGAEGERLPGPVVCVLWSRSRLPRAVLSAIWSECDPARSGALDRDAFARGMWRIDEELRRAALVHSAAGGASAGGGGGGGRRRGMR